MSYASVLEEVGQTHEDVVVIDAGLATSMQTHRFAASFPERYFNLGIAEQNAVSVASGIARRGFVTLVHSFSNFLARRAHDQMAVSVAWPGCSVKFVAGSCGVFDGRNGPSHLGADDLAVATSLPEMFVAEPADQRQTRALLHIAVEKPGPAYVRIRRYGVPTDLLPGRPFAPTTTVSLVPDARCTLVAGGSMLGEVMVAARILADRGLPVDLFHVAILRPLDAAPVLASARRSRFVVVVENHVATGGFGDAVAQALQSIPVKQLRLAMPPDPLPAGDPEFLLAHCHLDAHAVAERLTTLLEENHDL